MIKELDKRGAVECADVFFDIYKNSPFNYDWLEKTSVDMYFKDIMAAPNFLGFRFEVGSRFVGACFGNVYDYFKIKKYRICEIFVRREMCDSGFGTQMLGEIEGYLRQEGFEAIELTAERSRRSFPFYEKNGYAASEAFVNLFKIL